MNVAGQLSEVFHALVGLGLGFGQGCLNHGRIAGQLASG